MSIVKREGELKSAFTAELKKQLPGFLCLLQASAGAPDRAIVGAGRTSWWEFKHATPDFDSPGNQELMCCRLEAAGYCRYVIWLEEFEGVERTLIVRPREILQHREHQDYIADVSCKGFDHKWLVEQIRKVHRV